MMHAPLSRRQFLAGTVAAGLAGAARPILAPQLAFAADWSGERERAEARDALVRFVQWHLQHGRTTLAAEHEWLPEPLKRRSPQDVRTRPRRSPR